MGAAPEAWSAKLTRGEELRGLAVLLANQTLLNGSFFMLFPLISVHFTRDVGMSATVIGIVLAVRQFSQQGPMIFGGALADRIGYKRAIAIGLLVRGTGGPASA